MAGTAAVLITCPTPAALAARAADFIADAAREAIRQRGRFTLVLSGGSTPKPAYELLAEAHRPAAIPWAKTSVFFGDERFVPPGDPRSNFGLAQKALLARVPIPPDQVFPMPTEQPGAAEAALAYAEVLQRFFPAARPTAPPRFDLVLLGLGDDGHTASLFPGAAALGVEDAWVTWSRPGVLPPHVDRISLTYPLLNAARQVLFLVAGQSKALVLRDVLEGSPSRDDCPAAGVRPAEGRVTWLVDEAAAQSLTRA